MSETAKYRQLTTPFCIGNGVDIGSGGNPVVPTAIQIELPEKEYQVYNGDMPSMIPIQWRGSAFDLPFKTGVLDYVYSSHLIEDFPQTEWPAIFSEWARCLKRGGHMVILVPEFNRFRMALEKGHPPNDAHRGREPLVGEMSIAAKTVRLEVVMDCLTNLSPEDYSIIGVFRKP